MQQGPERKERRMATHARIVRKGSESDSASERAGTAMYESYDSEARDFDEFFKGVLAPYATVRDYAEAHYGFRTGELIGAEFGGLARKLFGSLNEGRMFRRTAGFVLHDSRNDRERAEDSQRGHDVVEADVFFKDGADGLSWHAVEKWTDENGKPDIIIERMVQGVDLIRRADLYAAVVKRWLSRLAEGGTLFAEISRKMPPEEREKVVGVIHNLEADEVAFSTDMTAVLIRRL